MSQTKAQLLEPTGVFTLTNQLVGVGATFSGNVSIAGTLTKQDVTNVDSVGLITARSGINVTGGNVFIGQGGSGANNAELKLQAGAGTGNDIIAFLNQAGTTKGNITYDTDHNFLMFNIDGAERARIGSSGLAQFKVDASQAAATQVRLENNAAAGIGTLPDIAVLGYASGGAQKASIRAAVYGEGWMSFHNNNDSEKMRLTAAGKLGIGVDSPIGQLDVRDASGSDPTISVHHSNADVEGEFLRIGRTDIATIRYHSLKAKHGGAAASNYIAFKVHDGSTTTSQTEVLRVVGSGNVGINTTSPAANLEISGNQIGNAVAISGTAIDCSLGNYFTKTITGATAFTFSNVPASGKEYSLTIELTLNGSNAVTWPAAVKWPGDAAPAITDAKTQLFMLVTRDGGTKWRGSSLVDYTT